MAKVLPLNKQSTRRTSAAAGTREAENGLQTIGIDTDDLLAELRNTRTVVNVAIETETEEGETSLSVGVLQLLGYKLDKIEHELQSIADRTMVLNGKRA